MPPGLIEKVVLKWYNNLRKHNLLNCIDIKNSIATCEYSSMLGMCEKMTNKKTISSKRAIWIMLLLAFLMSQNIVWKIIGGINYNEFWVQKIFPILQIEGTCIYTFLGIYHTGDKLWIERLAYDYPCLKKIFMFFIEILIFAFVWVPRIMLLIPELFSLQNINEAVRKNKIEAKQKIEKYSHSDFVIRMFSGIGGLTISLLIISYFVAPNVVQMLADVMTLILNIILFVIVCANITNTSEENQLERSSPHERDRIHEAEGLPHPEPHVTEVTSTPTCETRAEAPPILAGAPEGDIHNTADELSVDAAPVRDRLDGAESNESDRDGVDESRESNPMETLDEQLLAAGRGGFF